MPQPVIFIREYFIFVCEHFVFGSQLFEFLGGSLHDKLGLLNFTLFPEHPEFYATYQLLNVKDYSLYSDKLRLSVLDLTRIDLSLMAVPSTKKIVVGHGDNEGTGCFDLCHRSVLSFVRDVQM